MPKRSTIRQAVIYYVKEHVAGPTATVTESKELFDADSQTMREVDIVVEDRVGDDDIIVSVEVRDHKRRQGTPFVDEMSAKHARMPTNKLLLVSWSGFSEPAHRKAIAKGGSLVLLTPERLDEASVPPLFVDEMTTTPSEVQVLAAGADGDLVKARGVPGNARLYDAARNDVGTIADLVNLLIQRSDAHRQAHEMEDKSSLRAIEIGHEDLTGLGLHLHRSGSSEWHHLRALRAMWDARLKQAQLDFEAWRLGPTAFAMATAELAGQPVVYVLTDNGDGSARVSWRIVPT
jgi:hypothetical protein